MTAWLPLLGWRQAEDETVGQAKRADERPRASLLSTASSRRSCMLVCRERAVMFSDVLKLHAFLVSTLGYLLASAIAMAIVVHFWIPTGIVDPQKLNRLIESDFSLLLWQVVLGNLLGIGAGYVACQLSGSKGLRNSLLAGMALVILGGLGIELHPGHPPWMQLGKVIMPIPIFLLGGWIRLRIARGSETAR
ncbi:MAG: hypothetical protein ACLQJ0_07295 [Steroidobacteraceae bacterium]